MMRQIPDEPEGEAPQLPTAGELLAEVAAGRCMELAGWFISPDEDTIWMTNPYGIDVGFVSLDLAGAAKVLAAIKDDDHEREWA